MINKIIFFFSQIFLSKIDKKFISKNKLKKKKITLEEKNRVLFQMPEEYFYVIIFNKIINIFNNKGSFHIDWIDINSGYQKNGKTYLLKKILPFGRRWKKLFTMNGGIIVLKYDMSFFKKLKYIPHAFKIHKSLKTKQDVLNIKYNDMVLGDLIYDTYLRYKAKPTIYLNDFYLFRVILSSLIIFNESDFYYKKFRPKYYFTSYTSYLHHGIPSRLALKYNTTLITLGAYELFFNIVEKDFPTHLKNYSSYSSDYNSVDNDLKNKLLDEAKTSLNARLNGTIDKALYYVSKSSYQDSYVTSTYFINNFKKRVIIFSHDFYDSPHIRRWLLFEDFYEWLKFVIVSADTDSIDYFVKMHPNSSPKSIEVVKELLINFPQIKLIPLNISTKQLINEGFDYAITNHGTVAHELPLFNIPVLCSGDNPHVSFDFTYTAKSKDEFYGLIRNPFKLQSLINLDKKKEDVYKYYAMHYLFEKDINSNKKNLELLNKIRRIQQIEEWNTFVSGKLIDESELDRIIENSIELLLENY